MKVYTMPMILTITVEDWKRCSHAALRQWFASQTAWKPRLAVKLFLTHREISNEDMREMKLCGNGFACIKCKEHYNGYWEHHSEKSQQKDLFSTCLKNPKCDHIGKACMTCPDERLCKYLLGALPAKWQGKKKTHLAKQ